MTRDQIRIGGVYLAKVSDKVVPVRIDATSPHGGWDATSQTTGKKVRIKSAQRLRGPYLGRGPTQAEAESLATAIGHAPANAPDRVPLAEAMKPAEGKRGKVAKEPKAKKVSGLDAAYEVLKTKGEPMTCGAIVDEMLAKGIWKTSGKTPAQTIYSALLRNIDGKAGESRFIKTGRGLFAVAK